MLYSSPQQNIYILYQTMNRHNWTAQEDSQLRCVVAENGSEDWTKNAELLRNISSTAQQKSRTGKQCRQRWYNHLDPGVVKSQWKLEQQNKLFEMHKIHGNKWKQLTKYIPGRTDNDIKNHFYSTLRRSLRRLNKYTGEKNSTNQMRQIKPSVLTFIINHIYSPQIKQNQDRNLIQSLRQLPELVFKFSNFKPVKQNMQKKLDDNLKDRIAIILGLVDQFKLLYNKEKNQENSKSCVNRRSIKNQSQNTISLAIENCKSQYQQNDAQQDQDIQDENQDEVQLKAEYNSDNYVSEHANFQYMWNQPSSKRAKKQFAPIVTIQRKPSLQEPKPTSKKLILMQKIQQRRPSNQKQQHEGLPIHIRSMSLHEDDEIDNELMPIQQPSLSVHENSNFFGDLVIIGKHIEPISCMATNEPQNFSQIDEVLYENYQQ